MSERTKLFAINRSKTLWLMALTLAFALIFAGSAMTQTNQTKTAQKAPATTGTVRTVVITPGPGPTGAPSVNPQSVDVYPDDTVEWKCATGCDFDVVFIDPAKKPFKDRGFNKKHNNSDKPTGAVGTYKYSVYVEGGHIDPDVIIRGK